MSSRQWANIGEDAGALHALLQRVSDHVPVSLIDYTWIFPPRRIAVGESIVVVVGAYDENERRRVITAHFTVARNRKGVATVNARFDEHGSTPPEAVPRIVQGVLRRLGEDINAEPREAAISGSQARWDELIVDVGGRPSAPVEAPTETGPEEAASTPAPGEGAGPSAPDRSGPPDSAG
jgi:hypothetical protein